MQVGILPCTVPTYAVLEFVHVRYCDRHAYVLCAHTRTHTHTHTRAHAHTHNYLVHLDVT